MESKSKKTDRREFLKDSATSVGALALGGLVLPTAARGANERIGVGLLGVGSRGGALAQWVHRLAPTHGVELTAIGDTWARRREESADRMEKKTGRRPAVCRNLTELCERSDVDVVVIATADFQHCYHAAQAVSAGKDVYVEKPFGCDFAQVQAAHKQIAASDRVVQMGTQSRGMGKYAAAARFVQSGKLGQVTFVEITEPLFQQRWRIPGAETQVTESDVDWREFLAYLPSDTPFHPRHYREFRLFWPYSSGPFCQWMSHRIDLVNLVLGSPPTAAVSLGGVYLWKDGRTNPDTVQCLLEYPGGVLCSYHLRLGNDQNGRGITFYGTNGTLELDAGLAYGSGTGGLVVQADEQDGVPQFRVDHTRRLRGKRDGGVKLEAEPDVDYMGSFFEAVRSRRPTLAGVDAGLQHSIATILAASSYRNGCKMIYDPRERTIGSATGVSLSNA